MSETMTPGEAFAEIHRRHDTKGFQASHLPPSVGDHIPGLIARGVLAEAMEPGWFVVNSAALALIVVAGAQAVIDGGSHAR